MKCIDRERVSRIHKNIGRVIQKFNSKVDPCSYFVAGSHLHNTVGKESDIDIRGFHCAPSVGYVQIESPKSQFDLSWDSEHQGSTATVEVTSYELKTFGVHIFNLNINLIEAVICGQVTNDEIPPHLQNLRELLSESLSDSLSKQYGHMAEGIVPSTESGRVTEDISVNELLYAFRGVLAGKHLQKENDLCVDLNLLSDSLLSGEEKQTLDSLIRRKENHGDINVMPGDAKQFVSLIKTHLEDLRYQDLANEDIRNKVDEWMIQVRNETEPHINFK